MKVIYILFDGRVKTGARDTGDATVYVTCDSKREVRGYVRSHFPDAAVFKYDLVRNAGTGVDEALNERRCLELEQP